MHKQFIRSAKEPNIRDARQPLIYQVALTHKNQTLEMVNQPTIANIQNLLLEIHKNLISEMQDNLAIYQASANAQEPY